MQDKTTKTSKKRAFHAQYVSQNQLSIPGFETTFELEMDFSNRWVKLANVIIPKSNRFPKFCQIGSV